MHDAEASMHGARGRQCITGVVALVAFAALASSCGGGGEPEAQRTILVEGGETRADGEKGGYAVDGGEVAADPAPTIRVRVDERVTIRFDNVHGQFHGETWIPHDVAVVRDTRVAVPLAAEDVLWGAQTDQLEPGDPPETISFTPDAPGTYYYICTLSGHVDRGMWGKFVVES